MKQSLRIALFGATGNIGSRVLVEALDRGHAVTGIVRRTERLPAHDRLQAIRADLQGDGGEMPDLTGHDLAIVSIKWVDNDMQDVIRVLRGAGIRRAIFVMGAGSLLMPDGRTWYAHNLERGTAPPTSGPAVAAYEALCTVEDFDWTAVSPAAKIEAGQRTAKFRKGLDHLLQDASGDSRISYEDLAVAILDEAESAAHVRRRLTVAY